MSIKLPKHEAAHLGLIVCRCVVGSAVRIYYLYIFYTDARDVEAAFACTSNFSLRRPR